MSETGYIVLIVVLAILAFMAGFGGYFLMKRRGKKVSRENIPVRFYEDAKVGADSETPHATQNTTTEKLKFVTRMQYEGQDIERFERDEKISFGAPEAYANTQGIVTFRGNNYRNSASFGIANISEKKFDRNIYSLETGTLEKSDISKGKGSKVWSGSGWTGQPLIMRWDKKTREGMNIYPEKKLKENLTEAIYATMDGNVYFFDIDDGQKTRDVLKIGLPFKGAGALYPGGVPMLFVGAGDSLPDSYGEAGYARAFIYSLIDFEKLYELGAKDDFSHRIFHGYDSSPLIDAKTDTLIYPGENGIIYTMKLGTQFDAEQGTLGINPSKILKWTYDNDRLSEERHWYGMEDSAAYYKEYMYIADNGGNMLCININTMEIVWAQDVLDDTNASPVFEVTEAGEKYVYVAPSLHWEMNPHTGAGEVSIYKLNAMTGETVWEKPYEVYSIYGVSGGVQATPAVTDELIIVPIARTPYRRKGLLVALDKNTGEERWVLPMPNYAWSSPVLVEASDGGEYIVQANSKGFMMLIEAKTGKVLDKINLGSNIEASPAVFENTVIVGTRGRKIVGIKLK